MLRVMFICTANSCRSQMAEGFARKLGSGLIEPYSAGLMTAEVQPRAIEVMREDGIDISRQRSKQVDPELLRKMDVVITLCETSKGFCPEMPPQIKWLHWPIEDPVGTFGSEAHIMQEFRRARDEIKQLIAAFVDDIKQSQ